MRRAFRLARGNAADHQIAHGPAAQYRQPPLVETGALSRKRGQ